MQILRAFSKCFPDCEMQDWYPGRNLFSQLPTPDRDSLLKQLEPETVRNNAIAADLPEDWVNGLVEAARHIHSDSALLSVFCAAEKLLFESNDYDALQFRYWPTPIGSDGRQQSLFFLLLGLCAISRIRKRHLAENIPENITKDTLRSVGSKARDYYFFHRSAGIDQVAMYWLRNYTDAVIFRIGRLEYGLIRAADDFRLLQNPADGQMRLFMRKPGPGGDESTEIVRPKADGLRYWQDAIDTSNWQTLVAPGDALLDLHIPGGGKLDMDSVRNSMIAACDFFDRRSEWGSIRGISCMSWIFSPDIENIYPSDSNLRTLRRALYVYPVESKKVEGIRFLFGTSSTNPEDWPQDTSVQRRLKKHLCAGGSFRLSGMILPKGNIASIR